MMGKKGRFILASASPRRKKLLEEAGYEFDVVPSGIDESAYDEMGLGSGEHTLELARAKAKFVAKDNRERFVFGSDTVVDLEGEIIGKARDIEHAEKIIRGLFSKRHSVITSIALVNIEAGIEDCRTVVTWITPRKLSDEQIQRHLESGDWEGKAGAYGVQEVGDEFIEEIEGSFTNVIGLPMEETELLLDKYL